MYRLGNQALQAGAGLKRPISFTSAQRNSKTVLDQCRTGDLSNENFFAPNTRIMATKAAQRIMLPGARVGYTRLNPVADL